ncbi:hypothetical protein PFISCL1PPCAC_1360, partial [Pristionchus fissidentatus]
SLAHSGLRDEFKCENRISIVCDHINQTMSYENCKEGHEFFYCAKTGLRNRTTGDWILKSGVYSSHHPVDDETCMKPSANEVQVVLASRDNREFTMEELRRICTDELFDRSATSEKLKISPPRSSSPISAVGKNAVIDLAARSQIETELYISEKQTNRAEVELQRQIEDVSYRTNRNSLLIGVV